MMKLLRNRLLTLMAVVVFFSACQDDNGSFGGGDNNNGSIYQGVDGDLKNAMENASGSALGMDYFYLPERHELDLIPQDPNNPLSNVKIELGKKLFYETGLAVHPNMPESTGTYSCASCHVPGSCFQAGIRQGIGEGGSGYGSVGEGRLPSEDYIIEDLDIQPIRTPTAIHGAYNRTSLWNGQFGAVGPNAGTESSWTPDTPKETNNMGYEGLEIQAIAGLKVHRLGVNMSLITSSYYRDLFDRAFPEFAESDRYTRETMGLAIAAYERTLLANESPFQQWIRGDVDAMTASQKQGALLFFGKANCNGCHTGPALNSERFHALGMDDLNGDGVYGNGLDDATQKGRGGFTGNSEDDYKFKTPQLYGLKAMRFLGHGASFTSVREVIEYKNNGVAQNTNVPVSQLASRFRPLGLTDLEVDALTDFVENGLDDRFDRYVPTSIASGNCFPNNDEQSQVDMDCN